MRYNPKDEATADEREALLKRAVQQMDRSRGPLADLPGPAMAGRERFARVESAPREPELLTFQQVLQCGYELEDIGGAESIEAEEWGAEAICIPEFDAYMRELPGEIRKLSKLADGERAKKPRTPRYAGATAAEMHRDKVDLEGTVIPWDSWDKDVLAADRDAIRAAEELFIGRAPRKKRRRKRSVRTRYDYLPEGGCWVWWRTPYDTRHQDRLNGPGEP